MSFTLIIPAPETLLQFTWLAIGITFGRAFKGFDEEIQDQPWFKNLVWWQRKLVEIILDITHHWWIGMLMVLYVPYEEAVWLGWGLVADDIIDIPTNIYSYLKANRLIS